MQVSNSSIQRNLETFSSSITSHGWKNINRAPLIGFTLSMLVAAATTRANDLVARGTWICPCVHITRACASVLI
eukprot:364495-Chlamydomonas_euryale.AAC.9